jgi:hypothetical protein
VRRALRIAAAAYAFALPFLVETAAWAARRDDGEVPGKPLGAGMVILIYVVIPVGAFLVIAFFSLLPSMLRRPRYRPGRPWNHDPLWFSGPEDPNAALSSARPGATARGGASAEW